MPNKETLLGVNIDHVASIRQMRQTRYPDPVYAAYEAESAGADTITIHLREDRRHIQERDLEILSETLSIPLNLEMAITDEMLKFAYQYRPRYCCFVPERREELTTEGGLDVVKEFERVKRAVQHLQQQSIEVSLFIEPTLEQIKASAKTGAKIIELHTGCYANATDPASRNLELVKIINGAEVARSLNMIVNAGHGLNYQNVKPIAILPYIHELNIGHSIVARALMCGFAQAVREMKQLICGKK